MISLGDGNGVGIEEGGGFEVGYVKLVDFVFGVCEVRGVSVWGCW